VATSCQHPNCQQAKTGDAVLRPLAVSRQAEPILQHADSLPVATMKKAQAPHQPFQNDLASRQA